MKRPLSLLALAAAAVSCSLVIGNLNECNTNADCTKFGAGLVCQANLCVQPGALDAGRVDAGPVDAGPLDAGYIDPLCRVVLGAPDAGNTVLIGAILPKTVGANGPVDPRGIPRQQAIQLAIDGVNQAGGVTSHYLVVRVCDDQGTATVAETEGKELAGMGAVALITPGSAETIAAGEGANPSGVVVISGSATSSELASAGLQPDGGIKLIWSTAPSDNLQALVLTKLLLTLKPKGLAITHPTTIYRNDSYGQPLSNTLFTDLSTATDAGLTLHQFGFNPDDSNVASTAQTAAAAGPFDAVVVIGTALEADLAISSWTGTSPYWLFSDNAESTALLTGLDGGFGELIGSEGTGPATAGSGSSVYNDFSDAFLQAWAYDPATQGYLPNNYDAAMLIVAGIAYASGQGDGGINGEKIASGLARLSAPDAGQIPLEPSDLTQIQGDFNTNVPLNIQGASGDLNFDPTTGVAPGPIQIWEVDADGGISNLGLPQIPTQP